MIIYQSGDQILHNEILNFTDAGNAFRKWVGKQWIYNKKGTFYKERIFFSIVSEIILCDFIKDYDTEFPIAKDKSGLFPR